MSLYLAWNGVLTVDGTSTTETADELFHTVTSHIPTGVPHPALHLYGLDIESGLATAAWHDVVRRLRERHGHVVLVEAPQMLAHSLYKVGDLQDGRIRLIGPRTDDGTTAN